MTGQRLRDKQRTRDRIAQVATTLFLERGFDEVTVAEVAATAGVSKVTVFAHFARKEDLLLDLAPEALDLVRAAVHDRPIDVHPVRALRGLANHLAEQRHPLSGLRGGVGPFLRTVLSSPALLSRMREMMDELEQALATALAESPHPVAAPRLLASLVLAAYRTVLSETVGRMLNGEPVTDVIAGHHRRMQAAFDALDAAAAALDTGALDTGAGDTGAPDR